MYIPRGPKPKPIESNSPLKQMKLKKDKINRKKKKGKKKKKRISCSNRINLKKQKGLLPPRFEPGYSKSNFKI